MNRHVSDPFEFRGSAPEYGRLSLRVRLAWVLFAYGASAAAIAVFARGIWWAWLAWAGVLAVRCVSLGLLGRRIGAFGYAETEGELVLRRGLLFRSLEVIPYGRLQKVTVDSGPLMRRAGLANVSLVTASSDSDGSIPGVRAQEAERLRAKLTGLAGSRLEGL